MHCRRRDCIEERVLTIQYSSEQNGRSELAKLYGLPHAYITADSTAGALLASPAVRPR